MHVKCIIRRIQKHNGQSNDSQQGEGKGGSRGSTAGKKGKRRQGTAGGEGR